MKDVNEKMNYAEYLVFLVLAAGCMTVSAAQLFSDIVETIKKILTFIHIKTRRVYKKNFLKLWGLCKYILKCSLKKPAYFVTDLRTFSK